MARIMFSKLWLASFIIVASVLGEARQLRKAEIHARQAPDVEHIQNNPPVEGATTQTMKFLNPRANEFLVDGTTIPEVDWNIGPSWSGLLPISGNAGETRKLFFWLFPPDPQGSRDDLIFWTNGGPGCSSLKGLLQENGPFSWGPGQAKPTPNKYSWTNLSSVLWVEQPVGTGFSQGEPNIRDENDLAVQLVGFLQQFLEVFSELKDKNFYLSGESHAGYYLPYIANYIYENPGALALNLRGTWIADPKLSHDVIQKQIPAVNFVHRYEKVFAFNQTFLNWLDVLNKNCSYADYTEKYLKYPPNEKLPLPGKSNYSCNSVWEIIDQEAFHLDPAFHADHIFDPYPVLWDVLRSFPIYFNRTDVKRAIHAPLDVNWTKCSDSLKVQLFPPNYIDPSPPSALSVLPNVIEKNERTVIIHGLADFLLIAEGTRIVIQNMTWGGKQGFQTPIPDDSFIIDGVGSLGVAHTERGLTYIEVEFSGHMVPQFSPVAAFQSMQYLMGLRESP